MTSRMRTTKGKRNQRRANITMSSKPQVLENEVARRRHYASRITGLYKGRSVVEIKEKKSTKTEVVAKEKQTEEKALPDIK